VSLRFLVDTNILSEPLRPAPNPRVLARLQRHRDELGTAAPVWHEAWFGVHLLPPSKKRRAIEQYLRRVVQESLVILPYDSRAADWHAAERARLVHAGKPPTFVDGQIAAIAVANELTLVTANLADFRGFRDLKVVDWTA
jgi:tRNA(fMet)-specific endonuclease VapC